MPWERSSEFPRLGVTDVHVWRIGLRLKKSELARCRATLTTDERTRAARLLSPTHGRRFTAGRGILRRLLGKYLGTPPEDVILTCNTYGKPSLGGGAPRLRFNLSHSGDIALYAFSRSRELGVDIERVDPKMATEAIADQFFSPTEVTALRAVPRSRRPRAFFACWTRKEAYIKARGKGLSLPLDRFAVSIGPGKASLLRSYIAGDVDRWSLKDLTPGPGYAGALAVEGKGWRLRRGDLAASSL